MNDLIKEDLERAKLELTKSAKSRGLKNPLEKELNLDQDVHEKSDNKPLLFILSSIVALIFILSMIPVYSIANNPPPNQEVIDNFELLPSELAQFQQLKGGENRIQESINNINVGDYRTFTTRLVTSACETDSKTCYAKAIYYYVQSSNYYVLDPDKQYVQSPAETIIAGGADCEDKSIAVAVMMESVGIDADIGIIPGHAFLRAQLPELPFYQRHGEYVWLDPTSDNSFGETSFKADSVITFYEI